MDLRRYKTNAPPITDDEYAARFEIVVEYVKDYNLVGALVRLGYDGCLLETYPDELRKDYWFNKMLIQYKEQFFESKVKSKDPTIMGCIASRYYELAHVTDGAQAISALKELGTLLNMEQPKGETKDNPQTISELKKAAKLRGLPTSIFAK
jgi:hypothetical protein